jgi:tetratricopeptide (TPR) repeat protein
MPRGYLRLGSNPVAAPVPGGPRRFTLTFHVQPVTQHGPDIRPFQNLTASTSFTLSVDRPATALLPGYMPYMAIKPDERDVRISEARIRARYYLPSGDPRKLEKALAFYREVIRLRDEQSRDLGEPIRDSQAWFERGEVLRDLGRKDEARAAFEEALREGLSIDFERQDAERELKALR